MKRSHVVLIILFFCRRYSSRSVFSFTYPASPQMITLMITLMSELVDKKKQIKLVVMPMAAGGPRQKDDFEAIQCILLDRNALKYQLLTPKWLIHAIN